ncbi:MAG: hypothetical protein Q7R41_09650 [Phycisphaerales bacterium]|jgi:hypothetical protein|nr:hypothetical protein [Phycisphaerales bacterium]
MIATVLALFMTGMELSRFPRFLLMLPLCLSVAVIYKSTRMDNMREVPTAAAILWVTIVLGMVAVGVGLWAVFSVMA